MKWIASSQVSPEPVTLELVLDNLLTKMPNTHIYWKNKEGIYLGCNDAQAKSLGLKSPEEVIGKTDFDLPWDKELAKRFWENDLAVLTTGQPKSVEESTLINGEPAVVLSLKTPMKDAKGQVLGILGISVDVSEQKHIEQSLIQAKEAQEVANEAKQEFLENMRHDIRTPLAGIVGCAEIIKAIAEDPKVAEYANHLVDSSQALSQLLNEVLELITVGSKNLPLLKRKFSLAKLVKRMIALNQAKAVHKHLQLVCQYDDQIPQDLIGDALRIERVLLELMTNALNFTEEGWVQIKLVLVAEGQREAIIKITVQDTGMGIPLEKQREVFTRFKRMTPAYQGIHPGAGLGLAIIKQLIDDLDGELYFESQPGEGSTFTYILSLKKAISGETLPKNTQQTTPPSTEEKSISMRTTNSPAPFSILLVEDSEIAAKVTLLLLTRLGATVKIARTGKEAIEQARQEKYNLILLDIGLPDISGMEVAKQIRAWEAKRNQYTRIIALTAHVEKEKAQDYVNAGINEVWSKPLTEAMAKKIIGFE